MANDGLEQMLPMQLSLSDIQVSIRISPTTIRRTSSTYTIVFMLFTLSPYIDTFFNGFQQPQKRWHYMLVFFHAVLIAQ